MIYIDPLMNHGWKLRGHPQRNCHMFTDDNINELHKMAELIGMKRSWFQNKRIPHYDLTAARAEKAVELGVVQLTRKEAVEKWRLIQKAKV